jgi:hypothetical protein
MMLREGDWVYKVTGKDLIYFKSLKAKADMYEHKLSKMGDKLNDKEIVKKHSMLNPNVRPKSAGLINKKNESKRLVKSVNKELMNQFFNYLKYKKRGVFTHEHNIKVP